MSSPDSSENAYVIDIEQAAETARLIEQDKLFTGATGGLFPEHPDLSQTETLLDIGCGPAGWTLDVAYAYPHIDVVGIDINPTMIDYAFAQANSQGLENVSFEVMDVRKALVFPANSFDLINARLIAAFMDRTSWPALLAECQRILKPGGLLRLTEAEVTITSSAALDTLDAFLYQAFMKQGRSFSAKGRSLGITHMFNTLLRDAGFVKIDKQAFIFDGSCGTEAYYNTTKNLELAFSLMKPYIVKSGLVEEAEFDKLYQALLIDMLEDTFIINSFGLIAWCVKP